jgi:regulator of sirC expression with transglutaminase-like and TPR domain
VRTELTTQNPDAATRRLQSLLAGEDKNIPLGEVALLIAHHLAPDTEVALYLKKMRTMQAELARSVSPQDSAEKKISALNAYLFEEMEYQGNELDYYNPWNSFLSAVIDSKAGIPITLSILYMELGRSIGLDLHGVNFPGHFLVMLTGEKKRLVLNAFNNGEAVNDDDLRSFIAAAQGGAAGAAANLDELIQPASHRDILLRLLRNLKKIYFDEDDLDLALEAINLLILINPEGAEEYRDRGLLYQQLEAFRASLADLTRYLELAPDANDAQLVRNMIGELREINAKLN